MSFKATVFLANKSRFQPFLETKLKNRVSRYKTKKFLFLQCQKKYFYIFKIETFIKDLDDPTDMVKEILQYQGIRTNKELRDEYKKKRILNAKKIILFSLYYYFFLQH